MPNPPAPSPSGRKRSVTPDPVDAPSPKRHAADVTADSSGLLPQKIHFVVVGEITAYQADYLEIWRKYAKDDHGEPYTIEVWTDSNSFYDRIKFQSLVEKIYAQVTADQWPYFDGSEKDLGGAGPLDEFRFQLKKAEAKIRMYMKDKNLTRAEAIELYLKEDLNKKNFRTSTN